MTVVYRCDHCGKISDSVVSSGQFATEGGKVAINWAIASQGNVQQHLCLQCRIDALLFLVREWQHGSH
jgi:hypothetical protein